VPRDHDHGGPDLVVAQLDVKTRSHYPARSMNTAEPALIMISNLNYLVTPKSFVPIFAS
jgi:hypothetical protein